MRSFALVLHFYQPPTQEIGITQEILHTSYLPLLDVLIKHPDSKLTLNIEGSLLLQFEKLGSNEFVSKVNYLLKNGTVELLNSPICHPILPLTDPDVFIRQLEENAEILKRFFPEASLKGVYLPELAFDNKSIQKIMGISKYSIIDQIAVKTADLKKFPDPSMYEIDGFKMFVSARMLTDLIRSYPQVLWSGKFVDYVVQNSSEDQDFVCVTDAEIYGHHYRERLYFIDEILGRAEFKYVTLGQVEKDFKSEKVSLDFFQDSTWSTTEKDIANNVPFPQWLNPKNPLQNAYQEYSNFILKVLNNFSGDKNTPLFKIAYNHYDQGISSCHLYWLSNWPWWHPDLVQAGATQLIRAIRTMPVEYEIKREGEKKYHELIHEIWQYHWSGKVEENYFKYGQEREKMLKALPKGLGEKDE